MSSHPGTMPNSVKRWPSYSALPPTKRAQMDTLRAAMRGVLLRGRLEGFLARRLRFDQHASLDAIYRSRLQAFPIGRYRSPRTGAEAPCHEAALPWQRLVLQRSGDRYYLLGSATGPLPLPDLDGLFMFVIMTTDPGRVIVNPDMECPEPDRHFCVQDHTALSFGDPVLFAGMLGFESASLQFWTNDSLSYRAHANFRHMNLIPAVRLLLPDSKFIAFENL